MNADSAMPDSDAVTSICCLMVNSVGDTLCVTPALAALKARYPHARVCFIMRPHLRALVEGNPHVDEVLFFDTSRASRVLGLLWQLWRRRFDLWVDLHVPTFNTIRSNYKDHRRNALLMIAAWARWRVAYDVPLLHFMLTHRVPLPSAAAARSTNIVSSTLALVAPREPGAFKKFIPISAADRQWAAERLSVSAGARVALFCGSHQPADVWPDARAFAFIEMLFAAHPDVELVLVGGANEVDFGARVRARLQSSGGRRIVDVTHQTSLNQTAAIFERCDLVVSTDSGPMHIADAVDTPLVALFGSKNYLDVWTPLNATAIVLNHPVECGPCLRATCEFDNRCMNLITAEEVFEAANIQLARSASACGASAPSSTTAAKPV